MRGRVNCDSFAGLRALLVPPAKRASAHARRRRGVALLGIADAGRWSLIRAGADAAGRRRARRRPEAIEHVARILLRRYGVVCWRLLEREAAWLPPWRELVRVYRRLEARGEIRGGRFIAGLTGEQFALPEAIASMREVRRRPGDETLVCLAAADPANLLGTVVPGPKVARVAGARVVFRDGVPVATSVAGEVELLVAASADESRGIHDALRHGPIWRSARPRSAGDAGLSRRRSRSLEREHVAATLSAPRRARRGSKRSRSPSPIRFRPSTVSAIARPG